MLIEQRIAGRDVELLERCEVAQQRDLSVGARRGARDPHRHQAFRPADIDDDRRDRRGAQRGDEAGHLGSIGRAQYQRALDVGDRVEFYGDLGEYRE